MTTARRAVVLCRPDCDNAEIERLSRAHDLRVVYTVYTDTGPELAARIAVQYALDYAAEVVVIPYLSAREAGEVPAWRTVGRIAELVTGTGGPPGSRLYSAGWGLTADRVSKKPGGLDLPGLLDLIEARMKDAPERLQWAMNTCLAQIGIEHPEYRARAIAIGERLKVLEDYPTSPGCTSPFAPIWITEMVRRQEGK
jgi:hypothetical protein